MRRKGRSEDDYEPQKHCVPILKAAMDHINSVPYKVTLRWLFYRLLQDGIYKKKQDYTTFIRLQAKAKKNFYNGWRPDILADDTREVIIQGGGFDDVKDWLEAIGDVDYHRAVWHSQEYYIEVWFEAEAMKAQFKHYIPDIPLLAFHGDCSIAPKWEAAKRLEEAYRRYQLPIAVIYFGDYDEKGLTIPQSAIADIQKWCFTPITFIRAGLNEGDGQRLGISESIDKPGAYQWEALDDPQAEEIITGTVGQYFNEEAADDLRHSDKDVTEEFNLHFKQFIELWGMRHENDK